MYNSKNYKAMADKSTEKERMFNEWFTKSYNRLRTSLRKYGMPDEDNFHDTYLFVRKQVMAPGKDITDYEAYFIGCYRKAALVKIRKENRYTHPEDDFFLRCGEEAKFISEDDLERLRETGEGHPAFHTPKIPIRRIPHVHAQVL